MQCIQRSVLGRGVRARGSEAELRVDGSYCIARSVFSEAFGFYRRVTSLSFARAFARSVSIVNFDGSGCNNTINR